MTFGEFNDREWLKNRTACNTCGRIYDRIEIDQSVVLIFTEDGCINCKAGENWEESLQFLE